MWFDSKLNVWRRLVCPDETVFTVFHGYSDRVEVMGLMAEYKGNLAVFKSLRIFGTADNNCVLSVKMFYSRWIGLEKGYMGRSSGLVLCPVPYSCYFLPLRFVHGKVASD